jgi:bifunctional DNA-binding transcriptional regulator/antitoxin component of YhaV-PrlF toxin-antitoxin module
MKEAKDLSEIAKLNLKGQVTIPNAIRKFYLAGSKFVGFRVTPQGILLVPLEVKEKEPYTAQEWKNIEVLASQKGKVYKSAKDAKKHIDSL